VAEGWGRGRLLGGLTTAAASASVCVSVCARAPPKPIHPPTQPYNHHHQQQQVTYAQGWGTIKGPHEVEVSGESGGRREHSLSRGCSGSLPSPYGAVALAGQGGVSAECPALPCKGQHTCFAVNCAAL
jgi:hypothetical protein